jgi:hypothetical protein
MLFRFIQTAFAALFLSSSVVSAAVVPLPMSWDVQVYTPDNNPAYAIFHGKFTVENVTEEDISVTMNTSYTSGFDPAAGLNYTVNHAYGNSNVGAHSATFTSTNDTGGSTKILAGDSEQFFVWVHFQPTHDGTYRLQLNGFTYTNIQSNTLVSMQLLPVQDWWSQYAFVPGTNIPEPGTLTAFTALGLLVKRTRHTT